MAIQFSVLGRNAMLDALETEGGASAILRLRTGAVPENCAAADSGTVVATLNLPADWMADAASGQKAKLGTWEDTSADAEGTVAHFRIYKSDGTTCIIQGTAGDVGTEDMVLDNAAVNAGQSVTITEFTLTAGNA